MYFPTQHRAVQIDDMLAKIITAMTKEGKFKDAIQDRIGATVDTTDLDVTDTHYDMEQIL